MCEIHEINCKKVVGSIIPWIIRFTAIYGFFVNSILFIIFVLNLNIIPNITVPKNEKKLSKSMLTVNFKIHFTFAENVYLPGS